ncbi:MAG: hypothetical protein ABI723_19975 [Bacteroidia bacterium]
MKTITLFILLLFSLETYSQNKNKASFNLGFASMNFYDKLYLPDNSDQTPISQTGGAFFDFNFIEQIEICNRWYIDAGGGISQKGWTEEGIPMSDCGNTENDRHYKYQKSFAFINMQLGLSYDLFKYKKLTLNLGQLITPEFGIGNPEDYRELVFSTRTNLSLQYNLPKNIGLQLTPFFETALSRYNKKTSNPKSSDWMPYGYGVTAGVLW